MSPQYFVNITCTDIGPYCPVGDSIYGYFPSLPLNGFFVAGFALLALIHAALGITHMTYFFGLVLCVGCIAEAIGYGGRLMLHNNPYDGIGFSVQISCLIFAPSFVAAGVYVSLKDTVDLFGPAGSVIKPSILYSYIFITCDIVCLVLQAVGGGMAGGAGADSNKRDTGTNLMIAGIVTQVFTLLVFAILVAIYILRTKSRWDYVPFSAKEALKSMRFRLFVGGMCVAFLTILTRCVYRIPELIGGWASPIMRDEVSFVVLEGFMVLIAALSFATFHPGCCFPRPVVEEQADLTGVAKHE